ncbi:MAG: transglutaminase-like domain-containing protein [Gemmatimonadota bacterium]|nr:transglutaminase-like domain-containing protein [Gemmatimonadota bacterium]
MSRRAFMAVALLLAWAAGMGLLIHREYFRPHEERLLEAALLIAPGANYFEVMHGLRQIGFASSTLDTVPNGGVEISDFFTADLVTDGRVQRATARIYSRMTRGLRLRAFSFELGPAIGPLKAVGSITDDSVLTLIQTAGRSRPDTQHIQLSEPLYMPSVVPLAVLLGPAPKIGSTFHFSVFDPTALRPVAATIRVAAESLFVVADSARLDTLTGHYEPAHRDTVRAWRLEQEGGGILGGWFDEKGRMVQARQFGLFGLRRTAYEIAFRNWQLDARQRTAAALASEDIVESTAIASSALLGGGTGDIGLLRVRLRGADLRTFELAGGRQRWRGDTLTVMREGVAALTTYALPADRLRFDTELSAEPLVESTDPLVVRMARRAASGSRDARDVAERLTRTVHDYVISTPMFTLPDARQVLLTRRGDCNEHTQLYVALARAVGLPARAAAGLAYLDGKFYYHAWPEIWLGSDWVAVDPTFGQFPADAGHLRFVVGGYLKQAELIRLVGALKIDVLTAR